MKSKETLIKLYNRAAYLRDLLIEIHDTIIQYPLLDPLAVHTDITVFREKLDKVRLASNNILVSEISDINNWLSDCSTNQQQVHTALETCKNFKKQIDDLLACFNQDAF